MRHLVMITTMVFIGMLAVAGQKVQADPLGVASASGAGNWQTEEVGNQKMISQGMDSSQAGPDISTLQLDRSQVRVVQRALNERGCNAGPVDGIIGPKTRGAIRAYQENEGLAVTGLPNQETLLALAPSTTDTQEHFGLSPAFGEEEFEEEGIETPQFEVEDDMR